MEKNQILEGNKLIAEFFGAIEHTEQLRLSSIGPTNIPFGKMYFPSNEKFPDQMYTCKVDDLKYHSSWDWLMPIVNRIVEIGLYQFIVKPQWVKVQNYDPFNMQDISVHGIPPNTKIEALHKVTVDFIKWYNQNKQQ